LVQFAIERVVSFEKASKHEATPFAVIGFAAISRIINELIILRELRNSSEIEQLRNSNFLKDLRDSNSGQMVWGNLLFDILRSVRDPNDLKVSGSVIPVVRPAIDKSRREV